MSVCTYTTRGVSWSCAARRLALGWIAGGVLMFAGQAVAQPCGEVVDADVYLMVDRPAVVMERLSGSEKGSLLIFPKVELRWDSAGRLIQDTFLSVSNDYQTDVAVQVYFVNGDEPLAADGAERAHPGWNRVGTQFVLTSNQPTYWSVATGLPPGLSPFTVLDPPGPGEPQGRPDPEGSTERVLRGFMLAWAVDLQGEEISWNHLVGEALVLNYDLGSGWEYNAYAAQAHTVALGEQTGTPGEIHFDGAEFDHGPDLLMLDFQAPGSAALGNGLRSIGVDTDLSLMALDLDLRQDNGGPVTTKAEFDVWNENETKFSGTKRCLTCWDEALLSDYAAPNHFLRYNLQTDRGKARLDGVASTACSESAETPLLGTAAKVLSFDSGLDTALAGTTLVGMGTQEALIQADTTSIPPSLAFAPAALRTLTDPRDVAKQFLGLFDDSVAPPPVAVGAFGCDDGLCCGQACTVQALDNAKSPPPYGDDDGSRVDDDHYAAIELATRTASSAGTHYAAALTEAGQEYTRNATMSAPVLIFMADGGDEDDQADTLAAAAALKAEGVEIFTILFNSTEPADASLMRAIASAPVDPDGGHPGHYFYAPDEGAVLAIVQSLTSVAGCDDGVNCTDESCIDGQCVYTPNEANCPDDGLFCTGDEVCDEALDCISTGNPCPPELVCDEAADACVTCLADGDCDDGLACTDDTCAASICVYAPNDANCPDDGQFCNGDEACDAVLDCFSTGDPCAIGEFCNESTDTCDECLVDGDCADGVNCTNDRCVGGSCVRSPDDANCADNGLFCDGDEVCDAVQDCVSTGDPCAIGEFCNEATDACDECAVDADCDDGVVCTDDACVGGSCVYTPNDANCADDGLFCDGSEVCDAVQDCVSTGDPCAVGEFCNEATDTCDECAVDADCDDGVACTDDTCVAGSCVYPPNDANCPEDGLFCNGDEFCDAAADCSHSGNPCPPGKVCNDATDTCDDCRADGDCDDGIVCTDDACVGGACQFTPNDAACPDDGQFCNGDEFCDAALGCLSTGDPCAPTGFCNEVTDQCEECAADGDCDDGVACTDDTCVAGSCVYPPNDANCADNGQFCDGDETCDAVQGCVSTGDPCAVGEFCNEGTDTCDDCATNGDCDDGVVCTDDTCVGGTCQFPPNDANCPDDGLFCDGAEDCDAVQGCVSTGNPCAVGEFCNEGTDTCDDCATNGDCDDGVDCTDDTCVGGACQFPPNDANCPDNGLFCDGDEGCDAVQDCVHTGDPCPPELVCNEGTDACDECTLDAQCDDGNACTADACVAGACQADPLPDGTSCNDGDPNTCFDACTNGECAGSDCPLCGDCPFDANGNGGVDVGDHAALLGCFATFVTPDDPCYCFDVSGNGLVDAGDYAAYVPCAGELCPCPTGGSPLSGAPVLGVVLELVVSTSPVTADYADTLPASVNSVGQGRTFYVHVWASRDGAPVDELACGFADVSYSAGLVEAIEVQNAPDFAVFAEPVLDAGVARAVGGCVAPSRLSQPIDQQWARIATIEMVAARQSGTAHITLGGSSDPFRQVAIVGSPRTVEPAAMQMGASVLKVSKSSKGGAGSAASAQGD